MSALLRLDDSAEQNGVENISHLAEYAAENWVAHAKYGNVSAGVQNAMEYLFDLDMADKLYFTAWRELHDIYTPTPPYPAI